MRRKTPTVWLMTLLLLASGCASVSTRPVAQTCPPPPAPPGWAMQPEPGQSYTQQLQRVLSE